MCSGPDVAARKIDNIHRDLGRLCGASGQSISVISVYYRPVPQSERMD
jgi:hypothetical protein